jgi:hypothetical protein
MNSIKSKSCVSWSFSLVVNFGLGVFGLAFISTCGYKKRCGLPAFCF